MQVHVITGNQLRRARELAELSRERLAARAGLSRQTIYEYEQAGDEPAVRSKLTHAVAVLEAEGVRFGDDGSVRLDRAAPANSHRAG
jgi:transcriptional regulator with XRE-family HTH domain